MTGVRITRAGDPVRTITLSGFRLTDRYVLVTTDFADGPGDFENTGVDLMTALDADGREIRGVFATGAAIHEGHRTDFREWGLIFDDGWARMPICLDEPNDAPPGPVGYGDGHRGVVAFTAGRNEYLPGALCETEPAVQAFWLNCVQEMIDAGVDGVDFRIENHSTHTDFPEEYGYNEIVMEQATARNPRNPFAAVPDIRGDAYTAHLRSARNLLREHGRVMRVMLNIDYFRPDPPGSQQPAYPANIHFDWKQWIESDLMDTAVMRFFHSPFAWLFDDPVAQKMIQSCRQRGMPIVVNRYLNHDYEAEFRRVRQDGRFDGFILYETATVGGWDEHRQWSVTAPPAQAVCRAFTAT